LARFGSRIGGEPAKGPFKELPPWAQEFAEHLAAGDTPRFILHGQVFDYARVNGDYLPLRRLLAQCLSQERQVVSFTLSLRLEF
jgi:hypothetical protein